MCRETIKRIFIVCITVIIFSGGGCMGRGQLKQSEIDVIKDRQTFIEKTAKKGWLFNNRIIENQVIEEITVRKDTIKNVTFRTCRMVNIVFEDVVFKNCEFISLGSGSSFNNIKSTIENISFVRCTFINCLMAHNEFKKCIFKDVVFDKLTTDYGKKYPEKVLTHAEKILAESKGKKVEYIPRQINEFFESTFDSVAFKNVVAGEMMLERSTFTKVHFNKSVFDKFYLTISEINNVSIDQCNIHSLAMGGNVTDVLITNNTIGGMGAGGGRVNNIKMLSNKGVGIISFGNKGDKGDIVQSVEIKDTDSDILFLSGTIKDISVKNCKFVTSIEGIKFSDAKLTGVNSIKDCVTNAFEVHNSHLQNLTFENVDFDYYMEFDKVKFENLKLINIKYLNKKLVEGFDKILIKVRSEPVYINSDKFPTDNAVVK